MGHIKAWGDRVCRCLSENVDDDWEAIKHSVKSEAIDIPIFPKAPKKLQENIMKAQLKLKSALAVGLILISSSVLSQTVPLKPKTTYNTIGNTTFASDGTTYNHIGNTTFGSDGTSYRQIGKTTFGSDGKTYNRIGNTTFGSDGTSSNTIGKTTFGSNGTTCRKIGNTIYCN